MLKARSAGSSSKPSPRKDTSTPVLRHEPGNPPSASPACRVHLRAPSGQAGWRTSGGTTARWRWDGIHGVRPWAHCFFGHGQSVQVHAAECGGAGRAGHASICGRNGLLDTLVVVLSGGRGRQSGYARAGGWGQARARPASHTGKRRRRWLPGVALIELEGRVGLRQRLVLTR